MVRFDSTVTLVDALNLDAALADSPIAVDQITAADVIVLNKRDLVDDARPGGGAPPGSGDQPQGAPVLHHAGGFEPGADF